MNLNAIKNKQKNTNTLLKSEIDLSENENEFVLSQLRVFRVKIEINKFY